MLRGYGLVAPVVGSGARRRGDLARVFELLCLLLDNGDYPQVQSERTMT